MQTPGESDLRHAAQTRDLVRQFLQRAEGAEPAAIGPACPEEESSRDGKPHDEDQRIHQEGFPAEVAEQRRDDRQDIDHRELRIRIPADEDQREDKEARADDREDALVAGAKVWKKKIRVSPASPAASTATSPFFACQIFVQRALRIVAALSGPSVVTDGLAAGA